MRRTFLSVLIGLTLSAYAVSTPGRAVGAQDDKTEAPSCFDIAVVGTAPRHKWLPDTDPDWLRFWSPARITFNIEETLAGKPQGKTIDAYYRLHSELPSNTRHFLLFIRLEKSGRYTLAEYPLGLVKTGSGEFARPMPKPFDPSEYEDDALFPADYERMLKPIRYNPQDTWWLNVSNNLRDESGHVAAEEYSWGMLKRKHIVAFRGLMVKDWIQALSNRRCRGG